MIFVIQAGMYELQTKRIKKELCSNVYYYETYLFHVLSEDENIKRKALSTAIISTSKLNQRESYLNKLASIIIAIQLQNPFMDYIINFSPQISIEEIIKPINDIKSQLRLYSVYDDRFEKLKKEHHLDSYIQNFAMDSIQVRPVYYSESLFGQIVNIIEKKVNKHNSILKRNYNKDIDFIKRTYKNETIGEIDNLDYNLFEALADIIYYEKTKKDRRKLIRDY